MMPLLRVISLLLVPVLLSIALARGAYAAVTCGQLETAAKELVAARDSDPTDAVRRGEALLEDTKPLHESCATGTAMLLGSIASNLNILGRNAEAVRRYEQALETIGEAGSPTQVAFLHRGLGVALVDMEAYQPALEHYLTALAASETAGEPIESAKTAGNLGILYVSLGEFDKARQYHERSLAGFEAAGFKPGVAGALINLGAVAAKFGQQAIAAGEADRARREHEALLEHNERALVLFAELGNERGKAYAISNIGLALDRLGQPRRALVEHERSLALRRQIGDVFGIANSQLSIVGTKTALGRHAEAMAALDEAAAVIPAESFNLQKEVAEHRVRIAEARRDFAAALAAQREVTRLTALIADADQRTQIAALQDRFDADQAAREIDLLRSNAHIADLQLQRQRLVTRLSVLIAVLAIGLLLVLLSRFRIRAASARQLAIVARTDDLTGLPNRRHLMELMQYEQTRVNRGGRSFCLLMADLDDFKEINDRHGHDAGDIVLREVAHRLREAVRKQDTVARWGGEEFLLLLPESDKAGALVLADKLRWRIASAPFRIGNADAPATITLTLGCSEYQPGSDLNDCIREADAALYEGKHQGKNRTAVHAVGSTPMAGD